ncbi:MAG: MGMT family protein [Candidatus Margulisiibacteriota bacterium]
MRSNKEKILNFVAKIPYGKVTTYGRIAKAIGLKSPRTVGKVLHHNPNPKRFPCHRVVFCDGKLSPSFAFGGIKEQMNLLKKEGISFVFGKVDLNSSLM